MAAPLFLLPPEKVWKFCVLMGGLRYEGEFSPPRISVLVGVVEQGRGGLPFSPCEVGVCFSSRSFVLGGGVVVNRWVPFSTPVDLGGDRCCPSRIRVLGGRVGVIVVSCVFVLVVLFCVC